MRLSCSSVGAAGLTFRDKHATRSIQIIGIKKISKQQTVVTLVSWCPVLEHTFIED